MYIYTHPSNQLGNHQHIAPLLGVQVPLGAQPSCYRRGCASSTCNSDVSYNLRRFVDTIASSCPRRCPLHSKVEYLSAAPPLLQTTSGCWVLPEPDGWLHFLTWVEVGEARGHCQQGQTPCDGCYFLATISPRCNKYSCFFYFSFLVDCLFVFPSHSTLVHFLGILLLTAI